MVPMTWEQKLQACQAIGDVSLRMRKPGDWYAAHQGVERKQGALLSSGNNSGTTPEAAVHQYWEWLTNELFYIVAHAYTADRKAYRWNGFMWQEVDEKKEQAA